MLLVGNFRRLVVSAWKLGFHRELEGFRIMIFFVSKFAYLFFLYKWNVPGLSATHRDGSDCRLD